MTVESKQDIHF